LLAGAYALLFPIDWPEPFGLVQIEALACGTPVLAMNRGAVPELLRHGVTALLGNSVDELVALAPRIGALDRRACRREAERRFSASVMADGYEQVYARVIAEHQGADRALTCRART
jgi:glycosyltransferase involved in cell wall biosynthesis